VSGAPRLGIVAGGGALPARLIAACQASKRDVFVLALEGQAEKSLVEGVPHRWNRLGAVGAGLVRLKEAGVAEIVLAGHVKKPGLVALRPDSKAMAVLARLAGGLAAGDNAILSAVVRMLEDEGFRVVAAEDVLGTLLARAGPYGTLIPDDAARADIAAGIAAARTHGAADRGQAVVVRAGAVVGREDESGTDALLARSAGRGGVLVKVAKPGQERRADLPAIGPDTVDNAARAGLAGIAVEAGAALVLDPGEVARRADAAGLFVVGVPAR
jgi:UDP-2,3-diacylglucosamine hydrolase